MLQTCISTYLAVTIVYTVGEKSKTRFSAGYAVFNVLQLFIPIETSGFFYCVKRTQSYSCGKYYNSTESHKLVFSTLLTCNFRITSLRKVATNGPQKFLRYASALDCLVCPVHFGGLADAKLQKCLSRRQHLNERTIEKERMND